MGGALLHALQQALGSRDPAARDGEVAVERAVEERQPARDVGGVDGIAGVAVGGERLLLQLDRSVVLALEVQPPR